MNNLQSPKHTAVRSFLRVAGPILALIGLGFIGLGTISFFSAFGSFEPPKLFWCAFVGIPLLFSGIVLCKFGYFGAVARYMAAEIAPVGKDTVNYMAEGTKDAVKTVARAVAEGVHEARSSQKEK